MSGETPPGRFQSMNKKFTGSMSPGPNGHSPNGRGGHNRSRVLTSKVSAPRPINLPSLRREYASGAEWPAGGGPNNNANASSSTMNTTATTATSSASNSGTTGWGSSPSLSPFAAPQKWDTEGSNVKAAEWPTTNQSPELQSSSSPIPKISSLPDVSSPSISPHPPASSAWATVSTTSTPTLSAEFPTAAETTTQESTTTTTMNTDKNQKSDKKQTEKTSENDKKDILETENLDWDEIVRQDLENDDSPTSVENETVLPSDRFTEDYDRSYPPQIHPVNENAHLHAPPPSTHNTPYHHNPPLSSSPSQQHHHYHPTSGSSPSSSGYHNKNGSGGNYSRRDNAWGSHHDWNGYSRSNNQERRQSIDRTGGGGGGGGGGGNDGNTWGGRGRRDSYGSDQGSGRGGRGGGRFGNRRPSHDRKSNFQPTVLQRPRRMSELSARSDRSASRDESVELNQQSQQQQAATSPVSLPAVIEQSNGEVSSSSSPGHRYTAAQREVMLTAAERAKKRRDEEEAEFEAARERARKKAEALAAQCESKPKLLPTPKPDEKKQDEDTSTTSNKSFIESSDAAAINALSQQDKPWASPENESKPTSTDTTTPAGTVMTSTDNNQKPAQKEEESAVKASDSKEIKGKEHKRKDPATIPDSDSPAGNNDGEVSSSWAQIRSDKPHQLEDEKDNQRWEEYVKGIQNHKTAEAKTSSDSAAAGWNDYANRLQTSTEIRMNAAIDKYAADRNIDPALLDGMRPKDREPLRLQRPYRDNNMSGNAGGRRGYSNNNNGGNNNYSNRNGDRRQQNHRDDGRRDLAVNGKKLEQSISPVDQHQLSFESWPSLGGSQPTNNKAKQQQQQKTEQKVPLDDEENNLFKKKKKQSKVKNVDEKKASEEITLDHKDDEEKQEENGTIVTITATENMDEVSEKSKKNPNSEKCTDEDENDTLKLSEQDKEVGVSKKGSSSSSSSSFVVAENVITTTTDSSNDLSTKDDHQEKEKREGEQVTDKMDGSIVDLHEHDNHHPEEDVEESVPEMVEASESGSLVSHNITDTVPTPESELFVGRARTYSAVAVFDHWTRAERHDFLQKSKECIFPDAIERLAEMKPATLTFRTVSDDNQQTKVTEPVFDNTHSSPDIIENSNYIPPPNNDYMMDRAPYTVSTFDGKVNPPFMPPMTMAGRQNFPLLVYQVPYNGQGPFMPGSPNAAAVAGGYGITTADNQQPGMFIPAPMPQQFQGQPPQPSQQQPMMGVYLLSPNQMLPPWPGMPVNNNNNPTINNHNNNQRRRR